MTPALFPLLHLPPLGDKANTSSLSSSSSLSKSIIIIVVNVIIIINYHHYYHYHYHHHWPHQKNKGITRKIDQFSEFWPCLHLVCVVRLPLWDARKPANEPSVSATFLNWPQVVGEGGEVAIAVFCHWFASLRVSWQSWEKIVVWKLLKILVEVTFQDFVGSWW